MICVSDSASVFAEATPRQARLRSSYAETGPSSLKLRRDRFDFAEATPRQVRLRSTSYYGTRQHNIWKLSMGGYYPYPIIEDGFVCQARFLTLGASIPRCQFARKTKTGGSGAKNSPTPQLVYGVLRDMFHLPCH
jgi:hypothetical protein